MTTIKIECGQIQAMIATGELSSTHSSLTVVHKMMFASAPDEGGRDAASERQSGESCFSFSDGQPDNLPRAVWIMLAAGFAEETVFRG